MEVFIPQRIVKTYSIAAAGSISDTIDVNFEVSKVNVTAGADVTATLTFGGKDYATSFDVVSDFGKPCRGDISVSASNAGAAAETLTIEILGCLQERR
jgi:hypothetical protein